MGKKGSERIKFKNHKILRLKSFLLVGWSIGLSFGRSDTIVKKVTYLPTYVTVVTVLTVETTTTKINKIIICLEMNI